MRVEMTPQNFQSNLFIRIRSSYTRNKNNHLLYNDVLQILREYSAPANIHNNKIDITYITDVVKKKLKDLNIGFIYIKH